MKILMFGWEFPPHISGGLGTASYGLTKSLSELDDVDIIFVVPKVWGDEQHNDFQFVGANQITVAQQHIKLSGENKYIEYLGVNSRIVPYISPGQFWQLKNKSYGSRSRFVKIDDEGRIDFSGNYGDSLYREIRDYALVAGLIAQEKDFDVIHAHDWLAFPAGMEAQKVSGKPLVVHIHATDIDRTGGNFNPAVYSIEREGMEMADKVVSVSNMTRNTIIEKYKIDPQKVETVYNAVEPVSKKSSKKYTKIKGEKLVTFLGRITLQKGPEYFVEAAHLILKHDSGVRFIMAGDGDMMQNVVEHAARLGIANRFHFTGFLKAEEARYLLSISDVFVMPSVSEPFGITPLEAMQSGTPVIISKQSGVAEIVNYAIKIDFWDTFAMADAIHALLNYAALRKIYSKQGKIEVARIEWKNTAKQMKSIYKEVITSAKRKPAAKLPNQLPSQEPLKSKKQKK
ncbi:MAG: glycosyltransferase [Prolixibacteraceae bacterium]|nr:glycosyltransferase [Prolixibacteraceae bacterium]